MGSGSTVRAYIIYEDCLKQSDCKEAKYELVFSFPSSIKPVVENLSPEISFPKVTLCANGIHSMSRIKEKYPWLPQEVVE